MSSVRAVYRAIEIPGVKPPYDRASMKVYYPAKRDGSEEERNTGVVPADSDQPPFSVVIMMPGINIGPESYGWLARELANRGVVTVTYTLVAEEMPGYISLTPGLELTELVSDNYGKNPSATAVAPIIGELAGMNNEGVLAGCLNLEKLVLGGHSAGGTVALLNARTDWFPGLVAAFCYGAHTGAATVLGYAEDSFFPTPAQVPLLIMGGTRDGCIANSGGRYGDTEASATGKVERTFDEAIDCDRNDSYLAILKGANHFSMAFPVDDSTGRPFIDMPTTHSDEEIRALLAGLITDFVCANVSNDDHARSRLEDSVLAGHELIERGARR